MAHVEVIANLLDCAFRGMPVGKTRLTMSLPLTVYGDRSVRAKRCLLSHLSAFHLALGRYTNLEIITSHQEYLPQCLLRSLPVE